MKSELAEEIFELIEARSRARPTPLEFEMAFHARVAMDRIRFAIRHCSDHKRNRCGRWAGKLLDGLQRLETADRRFQIRSQVTRIKAFMSRTTDRFRRPYGMRLVESPSQCVFAETVNHSTYLRDKTGGPTLLADCLRPN